MQQEYWAYQAHSDTVPWAICAVCTYPRGTPKMPSVYFDIYSEELPRPTHCVSIADRKYSSIHECEDAVLAKIKAFSEVNADDEAQVKRFIKEIMLKG